MTEVESKKGKGITEGMIRRIERKDREEKKWKVKIMMRKERIQYAVS